MYNSKKEITINITLEYSYDSELKEIKELINQMVNLKELKKLEIENKD